MGRKPFSVNLATLWPTSFVTLCRATLLSREMNLCGRRGTLRRQRKRGTECGTEWLENAEQFCKMWTVKASRRREGLLLKLLPCKWLRRCLFSVPRAEVGPPEPKVPRSNRGGDAWKALPGKNFRQGFLRLCSPPGPDFTRFHKQARLASSCRKDHRGGRASRIACVSQGAATNLQVAWRGQPPIPNL